MTKTIQDIMVQRAGLTYEMVDMGCEDLDFEAILEGMKMIHRGKEVLYGSYQENHGNDPELFALMEHFCDMKRKYIRAQTYIHKLSAGDKLPIEELLDTYSDLAVYGVMGIQLIWHIQKRKAREDMIAKGYDPDAPSDDIPF